MKRKLTAADLVGPSKASGTQICYQMCPECGSTEWKFYLNPTTGKYFCFAGRHSAGGIIDIGAPFDPMAQVRERLTQNRETITTWPDVDMPDFCPFGHRAKTYLEQRGFSPGLCARHGWAEHRTEERILVPFRGPAGRWIYWTARGYAPQVHPKYMSAPGKHPLYVLPDWRPRRTAYLVEGVFDAMAVYQHCGEPAVALCGKSLPKYLVPDLLYLVHTDIIIMLDSDAMAQSLRIMRQLSHARRTQIVPLPPGEDPASMGPALKEYVSEHARDSE